MGKNKKVEIVEENEVDGKNEEEEMEYETTDEDGKENITVEIEKSAKNIQKNTPPSKCPKECGICGKTLSNSSNMNRHMQMQHPGFTCGVETGSKEEEEEETEIAKRIFKENVFSDINDIEFPIKLAIGKSVVYDFGNQNYAIYSYSDNPIPN